MYKKDLSQYIKNCYCKSYHNQNINHNLGQIYITKNIVCKAVILYSKYNLLLYIISIYTDILK